MSRRLHHIEAEGEGGEHAAAAAAAKVSPQAASEAAIAAQALAVLVRLTAQSGMQSCIVQNYWIAAVYDSSLCAFLVCYTSCVGFRKTFATLLRFEVKMICRAEALGFVPASITSIGTSCLLLEPRAEILIDVQAALRRWQRRGRCCWRSGWCTGRRWPPRLHSRCACCTRWPPRPRLPGRRQPRAALSTCSPCCCPPRPHLPPSW